MGVASIDDVLGHVKSEKLKTCLDECKNEHDKLQTEVGELLVNYGDEGKNPNPMAKSMSWLKTNMMLAIDYQEEVEPTASLISELKERGYRLMVLSNMSPEYIDFLRKKPVYGYFDDEIISCEVKCVKPEREIYELLFSRYGLTCRA